MSYWSVFAEVAVAHLLAVASPGPDFAIVLKQSLTHGRRTAVWTAFGVGTAILLHVTYSLLGLGVLLKSSPLWFNVAKFAGAAYITWLGIQSLRAKPRAAASIAGDTTPMPTDREAFQKGFFTNALNPKVTLFFVTLFIAVVPPETPRLIQAAFGLWMAAATTAWFSLVAYVFTRAVIRDKFLRHGHWIDRALGVVFLAFAAMLVVASVK